MNASGQVLEAVLSQKKPDRQEHPVVYTSRSLSPAEKNYETPALEYLAIYWTNKRNSDQPTRVITELEKETILFNMYSDPTVGYFYKKATIEKTRKRYYWPSMYPDII
ncbi:hypothetical protein G9A89_014575 [Geosiphon pyriformis]|nr:hypothetical protein G9A89_014575 [Geosiphon pyriformis]